jgi:transcriptional regulator with XRE-family HTH domain
MAETAVRGATAVHPLRVARLRRGLSQEALAQATRLDPRTIRRIERGAIPYPETARVLAAYFKCSPARLGLAPGAAGRAVHPTLDGPPPARAPEWRTHLLVTGMRGYTTSGVIGRPSLATAAKGQALLDSLTAGFAAHLRLLSEGNGALHGTERDAMPARRDGT